MRGVVLGATGNVGTAVVDALGADRDVDSIVARRIPEFELAKVDWHSADIVEADLVSLSQGADSLVHLAWLSSR
jgi:UDP-glucose 4-epimerase